jgi:hypothetical protein
LLRGYILPKETCVVHKSVRKTRRILPKDTTLRGDMVPMGTVCVTQNQVGGPEESCPRTPCKHGAQGDSVCRTELGKKTRKILPKDTLLRGDMVPKGTVCYTESGRRIRRILSKDTLLG